MKSFLHKQLYFIYCLSLSTQVCTYVNGYQCSGEYRLHCRGALGVNNGGGGGSENVRERNEFSALWALLFFKIREGVWEEGLGLFPSQGQITNCCVTRMDTNFDIEGEKKKVAMVNWL